MASETAKAELESKLEALVDEAREDGLEDETIVAVLSEIARKLREGLWRTGPVV